MKKYKKINSIFENEVEQFDIDCLCEYFYFKKGENHISNANIYRNMNTMILHLKIFGFRRPTEHLTFR